MSRGIKQEVLCVKNPDGHSSLASLKDSHSFPMPIRHVLWVLENAAKNSESAGSYLSERSGKACCVCSYMGGILSLWSTAPEENKSDWHKVLKWQQTKAITCYRVQFNGRYICCLQCYYASFLKNESCVVVRALLGKKSLTPMLQTQKAQCKPITVLLILSPYYLTASAEHPFLQQTHKPANQNTGFNLCNKINRRIM